MMQQRQFFIPAYAILAISAIISIFYGIEFTDTGYIEGSAYRIFMGQRIYQDFDYVRPPLTPWLWSFVFYLGRDGLELVFRSLVVVQKLITAFFIYKTLKILNISDFKSKLGGLLTFAFLLNFIASMPWHTTDGLFFLSASIMLFADKKFHSAVLFATFAALCKQSFYFAPFFVVFLLFFEDKKKILTVLIVFVAAALAILYSFGIQDFLKSTSGSGSVRELFTQGVLPHFYPAKGYLLVAAILLLAYFLPVFKNIAFIEKAYFVAILVPAVGVVFACIKKLASATNFDAPPMFPGITHAFASMILLLVAMRIYQQGIGAFKKEKLLVGLYLFFAAWMSSLSWGPNNYLFAYGFILASVTVFFDEEIALNRAAGFVVIMVGILLLLVGRIYFPYRMESPMLANYSMIQDGHYQFIMASPADISKLNSIKKIAQVPGCKDTYPSAPQAGLLGHYIPGLRADWKMDIEYPSRNSSSEKQVRESCTIFIERDLRITDWTGKYESTSIEKNKIKSCAAQFDDNFNIFSEKRCEIK